MLELQATTLLTKFQKTEDVEKETREKNTDHVCAE